MNSLPDFSAMRPIPGASRYLASPCGRIYSLISGKFLRGEPRKCDKRLRYTICPDGSYFYRRVYGSCLVLEAFVGPRPDGMEACHNDGNCLNDAINNLRWDTPTANKADMLGHGTRLRGPQINTAKLTEDDVREMRRIGGPLKPLAYRYGITETMVSFILNRKAWKHVE